MLENGYFKVLFYLKAILYDAKNDSKYCDVAPLSDINTVSLAKFENLH